MATASRQKILPELVFGVVGPMGVNVEAICETLATALRAVGYEPHTVHLTKEMLREERYELQRYPVPVPSDKNFYTEVNFKINYANALCKEFSDFSTMARIALRAIGDERERISGDRNKIADRAIAYVVRQLKRPDEAMLLRRVYGKQFVLISAYGSAEERQRLLEERLQRSLPPATPAYEISCKALELIEKDAREDDEEFGQNVRETFHLADVFIDGLSRPEMEEKITRFIQAFFGRTDIAPSKAEYGMYAAKSASLRSSDLSRQVGAAIFTDDGELITQGCNEVPKAHGGTYWDLEQPDFRDVRLGYDPNDLVKTELLRELFDKMSEAGLLSAKAMSVGNPAEMVEEFTRKKAPGTEGKDGPLARCAVLDLTEFGRVVHAEMCAICDAARLGRSVKDSNLFVTTFPCHNCTKHILAAGIKCVVYMEPYPKSRAKELHKNEIEIEKITAGKVSFLPFLGISPLRYRDIFQKGRRKSRSGAAVHYLNQPPSPMLELASTAYLENENLEWFELFGSLQPQSEEGTSAANTAQAPAPQSE
ncbi:anti-phage dCTP deaminase [Bradyrhizobium sp. Gha]|uniref:anti-phage dCTP deaminase n=1 Tax=Bradyrhizobium sp. Gha TaxID=1855318 RepID=UPI0008E14C8D|nr:anti-phage dCTP deaminase [Bradyrhizobium sp. Gha]SFJ01914.1 cytidine deaminase [Bradyrhizobium sp. Gha]